MTDRPLIFLAGAVLCILFVNAAPDPFIQPIARPSP
jgi:hypothetical protein